MPRWHVPLVALVLSLAAASAAVAGTVTDPAKFNRLQPGATTAAQTVEILGEPDQENRSPDGRFAYMYEFDLPNTADPAKPGMQGVAALLYSQEGVLIDMQLLKKAGQ